MTCISHPTLTCGTTVLLTRVALTLWTNTLLQILQRGASHCLYFSKFLLVQSCALLHQVLTPCQWQHPQTIFGHTPLYLTTLSLSRRPWDSSTVCKLLHHCQNPSRSDARIRAPGSRGSSSGRRVQSWYGSYCEGERRSRVSTRSCGVL